ncbi:MAG: GNAT family N-acetyltransferase [Ignavibacteriales bacterium]
MPADQPSVTNNRADHRLEINLDGETAFAEYRKTRGGIVFPHTVVPKAFEGRGFGSALVKAGLEFAKEEGLPVIPTCSFFVGWLARHPEHWDKVHPRYRDKVSAKP